MRHQVDFGDPHVRFGPGAGHRREEAALSWKQPMARRWSSTISSSTWLTVRAWRLVVQDHRDDGNEPHVRLSSKDAGKDGDALRAQLERWRTFRI